GKGIPAESRFLGKLTTPAAWHTITGRVSWRTSDRNFESCRGVVFSMKKAIAILYQGRKQDTSELAHQLAPHLQAQGYAARIIDIRCEDEAHADCQLEGCTFVLVLGGDGTILHAARLCASANIPLVGVNFGRVGFLTELEPHEVVTRLPLYLERDESVWIDKRSMLDAELVQD